jgi:hypothetical protein
LVWPAAPARSARTTEGGRSGAALALFCARPRLLPPAQVVRAPPPPAHVCARTNSRVRSFANLAGLGLGATEDANKEKEEDSADVEAAALKRSSRRQTAFPSNPLGDLFTLEDVDELTAARDTYIRRSKKYMKTFGRKKKPEIEEDDEEEEEEEDDSEEEEEVEAEVEEGGEVGEGGEVAIPTIDGGDGTDPLSYFLPSLWDSFAGDIVKAPVVYRKMLAIVRTCCNNAHAEK